MKKLLVLLVILFSISCEVKQPEESKKDKTNTEFSVIVTEFCQRRLPQNATSEFILRLGKYIDMPEQKMDSIIRESFSVYKFGNEIKIFVDDHIAIYTPGKIRLINGIKVGNKKSVGFRSLHASLAEDLIDMLKKENFRRFGKGKAGDDVYIYRKNGYSVMFKYNSRHDMWEFILYRYKPSTQIKSSSLPFPKTITVPGLINEDYKYIYRKMGGISLWKSTAKNKIVVKINQPGATVKVLEAIDIGGGDIFYKVKYKSHIGWASKGVLTGNY